MGGVRVSLCFFAQLLHVGAWSAGFQDLSPDVYFLPQPETQKAKSGLCPWGKQLWCSLGKAKPSLASLPELPENTIWCKNFIQ